MMKNSFDVPLDYNDPSLDFFSAKVKIIGYLKAKHHVTDAAFENSVVMDMVENWAYAADLLSQGAGR